jgi:hypothetical protein
VGVGRSSENVVAETLIVTDKEFNAVFEVVYTLLALFMAE